MRKEDLSKAISNIDNEMIEKAFAYKSDFKKRRYVKAIALVASLAILVVSIPLALILNREDEHSHHEKAPENGILGDTVINCENIQLSSGSLILTSIKLHNGKIIQGIDESHKYAYDYEPIDVDAAALEMIRAAKKYHDSRYLSYPDTVTSLGNAEFSVSMVKDNVIKKVSCNNQNYGFLVPKYQIPWDGSLYLPEGITGEDVMELISPEIEQIGELLGCNLDSFHFYDEDDGRSYTLCLWDSNNREVCDKIAKLGKIKYKEKDYGIYTKDYLEMLGLVVDIEFTVSKNSQTEGIRVRFSEDYYKLTDSYPLTRTEYLSLNIGGKRYLSTADGADLYRCAMELEQYIKDVFGVSGFTGLYEVRSKSYYYNKTETKSLVVQLESDGKQESSSVVLDFATIDGQQYYLESIHTRYSVADGEYIELIDEDKAITNLALGRSIGDIGLGCRICRSGYLSDAEEYIRKNAKWRLVLLPDVVFVTNDKKFVYEFPLYEFTVPAEEKGSYYVAYVVAIADQDIEGFDLYELHMNMYARQLEQCKKYNDHSRIQAEKNARIEEMIKEMMKDVPENMSKVVYSRLKKQYIW